MNLISKGRSAAVLALLSACSLPVSDAFTVTPPPPAVTVVTPTETQLPTLSSAAKNLPSDQEFLKRSSSTISLSAAAPATASPAPAASAAASAKAATSALAKASTSTADIAITSLNFDGKVPTTEADEYVVISNQSKNPTDVSGYYVYVATTGTQGPTFTFPKGSTIPPGKSVRIYTNEIHKETGGYSFGSGKAIWNNKGGLAVLKNAKGQKLGEFKY
jgi:hypothetical protein